MLKNIQALRALAAYLVVFVHLRGLWNAKDTQPFFGHAGVDLFFVISGFIMVYSTRAKSVTPLSFGVNRIIRVVPLYWLVTLVVFCLAFVFPRYSGATRADPMELLKSLLFIPFLKSNGLIKPVLFLGWTLNYEMFFYFFFTLALFVKNRALGLAGMVACFVAFVLGGAILQPTGPIAQFYTDSILLEFALGILIGFSYERLMIGHQLSRWSFPAILMGVAFIVLKPFFWEEAPRLFAYGVPAAVVVAAAINFEANGFILRNPTVQFLGAASYSIYLTHFFVTMAFVKLAAILHLESVALIVALVLITLLMVTLIGGLTHVFVEQRLTRWGKAIFSPGKKACGAHASLPPPEESTI